jgi:hypothetical protein
LIRVGQQGIPPGEDGHDVIYSQTILFSCRDCRGSEIEIYTHDCFDHEDVFDRYEWYLLGPAETAQLLALVGACPAHLSAECVCPIHAALRTSCRSLPSSSWLGGRGVEADFYVQRAYVEVKDGLPRIATKAKGS